MKIAVMGGGIAGLFTAFYLQKRGVEVIVLEKDRCGRGCSWDAAGMLAPVNELEFQELDLLRAGVASRAMYDAVERELGDIGMERAGTLEVGLRADDEGFLRRLHQFQVAQGLDVEWMSGGQLREMEPFLAQQVPGGIWSAGDIQVDNRLLVDRLRKKIEVDEGKVFEGEEIVDWEMMGGKRVKVIGKNNHWEVDALVVTVGVGNEQLSEKLPYKVYPVRGEMIALEPPAFPFLQKTIRIRNKIIGNAYIVPKKDRILCGATSEEQGFDPSNTAGGLMDILRKCYAAVPGIYELRVLDTWAGLRPSSLSRLPILDREAGRPIFHLNGLYRHGILLGPLLGEALAHLIMTGERRSEVESFRFPRF